LILLGVCVRLHIVSKRVEKNMKHFDELKKEVDAFKKQHAHFGCPKSEKADTQGAGKNVSRD